MTMKELYDVCDNNDCQVLYFLLPRSKSVYEEIYGKKYIGLSYYLSSYEERVCLAHECGHVCYAGLYTERTPFDTVDRIEYRAKKYSYLKLIPPGELRELIKDPFYRSVEEIADHFDVTVCFASEALKYYIEQSLVFT